MEREEKLECLKEKVDFVAELSKPICKYVYQAEEIRLEVWENTARGFFEEFLVIVFDGGAISVRNCSANSHTANLHEIADKINGGYYGERDYYKENIVNNPDYVRIY